MHARRAPVAIQQPQTQHDELQVLVVLDEAYIEFSEEATRMPWVSEIPNLVVLRTFSKSAGLAGLRVGCVPASTPHAPSQSQPRQNFVSYMHALGF